MTTATSPTITFSVTSVPAWVAAQSSGTVSLMGSSWLSAVGPTPGSSGAERNTVGPFSYSGGVLNPDGFYNGTTWLAGPAIMVFGGGHGAYSGNELLAFRVVDRTWYTVRPGGPFPENTARSGGMPVSRHSYGELSYISITQRLFSPTAGSIWSNGYNQDSACDMFDFTVPNPATTAASNVWIVGPDLGTPSGYGSGIYGDCSVYDSVRNRVIYSSGGYPGSYFNATYDVATNTWTKYAVRSMSSTSDRKSCTFIPEKNWMIMMGGGLFAMDCSNMSTAAWQSISPPGGYNSESGVTWDSTRNRLVIGGYGNTLYYCTPPSTIGGTWSWTSQTFTGATAPGDPNYAGSGMNNRFAYIAAYDGCAAIAGPASTPAFYKF